MLNFQLKVPKLLELFDCFTYVWYERTVLKLKFDRKIMKNQILLHNILIILYMDLLYMVKGSTSLF